MTSSGVEIEYDTFGDPSDPPLLLVMGFGTQLIGWEPGFCERLAGGGRFVIRYDNRDCGLSTKFDGHLVDLPAVITAVSSGDIDRARSLSPYSISDMASDGFGLLSELAIKRAHVVGSSMGGVIAQTMAIEHPERVMTLTSMMSATGEPDFGQATPEALTALLSPTPADRPGYIDASRRAMVWGSKRYADVEALQDLAAQSYDRCHYPEGVARQLAALLASGSRAEALEALGVPTLVIHGLDDTLVAPSGGERTAQVVPGARLILFEDMGHDRPVPLWPQICAAILDHTGS